jgi:hypothetical protein
MIIHMIGVTRAHAFVADWFVEFQRYIAASHLIPFFIVSFFAGIMASNGYIATEYALSIKLGEPPDWMDALMVIQWIASYVSQLMLWVICAAVAHLTAVLFDGRGKFADLFFFWGYGYLPLLITAACLYGVLSASLGTFTDMALSSTPRFESIPGLMTTKVIAQLSQLAVAAWGIYSVARIHLLSVAKSFLSLALPLSMLIVLRFLFHQLS